MTTNSLYMACDVFVACAVLYADILRLINSGRGYSFNLAQHVVRVTAECRFIYRPPPELDCKDPYYEEFYG